MNIFLQHSPKSFIKFFLITIFLLIICLVILNIIVDPFGIFKIITIKNINAKKPSVIANMRLAKAYLPRYYSPSAAIFGASKVELALNPEHPGFKFNNYNAINMGMTQCGLFELSQYLKHTYYSSGQKLRLAIIGLDYDMLNINHEEHVYDAKRLLTSENASNFRALARDIEDIFLFKALRHSWYTFNNQDFHYLLYPTGMKIPSSYKYDPQVNEQYYIFEMLGQAPIKQYCPYCVETNTSTFDTLREIIKFARSHNITLKFFFSPSHATQLIAMREAGLWQAMVTVKREIVNILAEDAARYSEQDPYILWDFSNFNKFTTESTINEEMPWHIDVVHYKTAVGDQIINKLLDYNSSQHANFGVILTKNNINKHLQQIYVDSLEYNMKHPNEVKYIRKLANTYINKSRQIYCTTTSLQETKLDLLIAKELEAGHGNGH